MSSFIPNSNNNNNNNNKSLDINNNDCCKRVNNMTEMSINFNSNYNNSSNRRKLKKINYRRYRSGSSSDSAINFDNVFEEEDDFIFTETTDLFDDFNSILYNFACLALQERISSKSLIIKRTLDVIKRHYNSSELSDTIDKFGFMHCNEQFSDSEDKNKFLEFLVSELLNARSRQFWSIGCESIKCLIREYGIPNEIRAHIWLKFIKEKIDKNLDVTEILKLINENEKINDFTIDIIRQIDLDVTRTFPNHKMFFDNAEGISKLRRILIGYCIYVKPNIGYCQGMNFIAALLLIVFDGNEEHSLMGLICIIDHYFPPHYYDQHLTGARADQMLLIDLISSITSNGKTKLFTDSMLEELTSALSLNWFLSLYHSALPWQVRLYIIDCFWLEGVKVLFRFSLALIKMGLNSYPIELNSSGDLINTIRYSAKNCYDVFELKKIAFHELKLPKRKYMAARRAFYVKQINCQIQKSTQFVAKETTTQWIRRRSSEILGLKSTCFRNEYRIVISFDQTKVAVCKKGDRSINEISILCVQDIQKSLITHLTFKNPFIIGISNDGNKILCTHSSSKTMSKTKDGIKIDLIGVEFDACDGFYLEEYNFAIIIGFSGVITKYKIDKKEVEKTILLNDKFSKVISADLDKKSKLVWLDTLLNNNNTHHFISFDIHTLDIYTTINTDCFSIQKFSIFSNDNSSLIIVKSDPINGKLMKAIDILTKDTHKERLYDSNEEIFDIQCFSFPKQIGESVIMSDSTESIESTESLNSFKIDKSLDNFIILVTKNSSSIAIEYKYHNFWKKSIVFTDKVKDISEINAIKIVRLLKDKTEFNITLLVYTSVSSLINLKF